MVLFACKNGKFCHENEDTLSVANISYKGFCNQLSKKCDFFGGVFFFSKRLPKVIVNEMEPLNSGPNNFRKFRCSTKKLNC